MTTALSKDGTNPYPKVGNIRTISAMCALTKCYEAIILLKVQRILDSTDTLHTNQKGFREDSGCDDNIARIAMRMS